MRKELYARMIHSVRNRTVYVEVPLLLFFRFFTFFFYFCLFYFAAHFQRCIYAYLVVVKEKTEEKSLYRD